MQKDSADKGNSEKSNAEKGKIGEKIARSYLEGIGYKILRTNYSVRKGEVDIIAQFEEFIVFVEVKYRKNCRMGYPRESVNFRKQNKIKVAAMHYIVNNGIEDCIRFDVIEVTGIYEFKVEHIKNAFQ